MRLAKLSLNVTASAIALIAGVPAVAGTLPASGTVASGSATISTSGSTLTVTQSSANAVINWQSFSIGQGNTVVFAQPDATSATLNRVTGNTPSSIAGSIVANGSVYLINPNGIEITKTGTVNVGRAFIAATLDIADADFLAGKGTFTGKGAALTNAGTITTATGGFVGLLGGSVANSGTILAPAGRVVIGAGTIATLDVNGDGFLQVALPKEATLSTDGAAALVSGRAARDAVRGIVNLPGTINAQSVSGNSGNIDLGGTISVDAANGNAGSIKVLGLGVSGNATLTARATGASGNGGLIETSGNTVDFNHLTINTLAAHGKAGTWLIDPLDLTIDANAASNLHTALGTSNVILQTTGASDSTGTSSATGSATAVNPSAYGNVSSGNGDIVIASAFGWSAATTLTLAAYNNIVINAAINAPLGGLVVQPGNATSQTGTVTATAAVTVGTFTLTNGNWTQNAATLPAFSATNFIFDPSNASFLRVTGGDGSRGNPYQITDAYGLQGIASYNQLANSFVLMNDIDASGTVGWGNGAGFIGTGFSSIGIDTNGALITNANGGSGFAGTFNGNGHKITGLVIEANTADNVGLFGYIDTTGLIENVSVTTGATPPKAAAGIVGLSNVGVLAGTNLGTIANSTAAGTVNDAGGGQTGGLAGVNSGTIKNSSATTVVTGSDFVGGLVGDNGPGSSITSSFASGTVKQTGASGGGGGLAGENYGTIKDSYATGAVTGVSDPGGTQIGGLVGYNQATGAILGSYATGNVRGNDSSNGGIGALAGVGGLVGENAGSIANDGTMASYATGNVLGNFGAGGLVGQQDQGGSITNSYATGSVNNYKTTTGGKPTAAGTNFGGLVGGNDGSITNSYATGAVSGQVYVGGLVGANYGTISDSYATGSATAGALLKLSYVGGLVGDNHLAAGQSKPTITDSYATGAVSTTANNATAIGGLVGSNTGTITASFFNTQTTGQHDTNGGTGVTTAQLQSLSTFTNAGWAIDNTGGTSNAWRIYDGNTAPLLRSFLTPLTVTGSNGSVTYNGSQQSFTSTYTIPNGANSALLFGTANNTGTASGTNAGTYNATGPGFYSNQAGYDIVVTPGVLTINPSALTVVTVGLTGTAQKVYDGTTTATLTSGNFQLSGFVNGDGATINQTVGTYASANAGTGITVTANLSLANFTATGSTNLSNYVLPTSASGNIGVITKAPLTVTYTANAASSTYGQTIGALSGSVSANGLAATDTLASVTSGTALFGTTATSASGVGSYGVTGSGLVANSNNYNISFQQAGSNATALTINPASLVVTYTANAASSVYGNAVPAVSGAVSQTGLVNGDTLAGVTTGTAQFGTTATATSNVGQYAITGSGLAGNSANYTFTFQQAAGNATALAITPRALTASLTGSITKQYDSTATATLGANNYQLSGFVNGDGASVTQTTGTYGSVNVGTGIGVSANLAAGNFTATGATNLANYTLPTTASGNIGAITQAPLTVTYTANAASSTYGQAIGALSGSVSATGLAGSDTLAAVTSGTAQFGTTATSANGVGSYAINGSGLAANSNNYSFTFQQAGSNATALTINPASLVVTYTANAASSVFGSTPSGLSGVVSANGLVNGDVLSAVTTGTAQWTTPATATSNVGQYAINGSGLSGNSANYTVSFQQAASNATALTITAKPLTVVTAGLTGTAQKVYDGTTTATLTSGNFQLAGFVNGDGATVNQTVGTYASANAGTGITVTAKLSLANFTATGSTDLSNYALPTSASGNIGVITKAPLTVTYTANAASSTYGQTIGALSGSVSANGLAGSDTLASVTSGTALFGTTATSASGVGSYGVTGSGLAANSNNYDITFQQAGSNATALTINPASLVVTYTANAASSVYGNAVPAVSGAVSQTGLVNGDTLAGVTTGTAQFGTTATATSNVGQYAITGSGLAGNSANYTFTFQQAAGNATALAITPRALTASLTGSITKQYDSTATATLGANNYQLSGFVNGDGASVTQTTGTYGSVNVGTGIGVTANLAAGNFTATGATNLANYTLPTTASGNIGAITQAPLTLTYVANAASSTYGQTPTGLGGTIKATGLFGTDTIAGLTTGTAQWTTTATATTGVGSYAINGSGLSAVDGGNYAVSFAQAGSNATALTINPATLTVTYTANTATSTYGTTPQGLGGSFGTSGLVNGDSATIVLGGTASFGTAATATSNVGSYAVTGSGLVSQSANYTINAVQAAGNATALTINPATLTITANAATKVYGAANPALTFGETGLVNGDTIGGALTTGATSASGVGTYAITQGTLSAGSNYTISYTGANLAVTPAPLTVTYTANTASSTYGTAPAGLSGALSASGLVNGDTLAGVTSGSAQWTTAATAATGVGSYAVTGSGVSANSANYSFTFQQAAGNATALTINPATLTVTYTANTASGTYGSAVPALSGTASETGFVNGDTAATVLGGSAQFASTASAKSNAGSYAVNGSGLSSISANYTLKTVQAAGNATALTINPALLTITANAASKVYGAVNPSLTYTDSGLVNGDTLSGALATSATAASGVGTYAITLGSLSAGSNYTISYTGANLAVTPAALTLTYTATPANSIFGTTPTGLTGAIVASGLVNGDTVASVTSGTAQWTTPATAASPIGSYAIDGSGLAANSANYTFTFQQAAGNATALTVIPATAQFGSNTVSGSQNGPAHRTALNGSGNDVSPLNLDLGDQANCKLGTTCPGTN